MAIIVTLGSVACSADTESPEEETVGSGEADDSSADGSGGGEGLTDCGSCSNGCCDGDTCIPYVSQSAELCGGAGASCLSCAFGELCEDGACSTDTSVCSALTCSGCCVDNTCVGPGEVHAYQCGVGGEQCGRCEFGSTCSDTGECDPAVDPEATFYITVDSVELQQTNAGTSWDLLDPPDPYVCLVRGTEEVCSEICKDRLQCEVVPSGALALPVSGRELLDGAVLFRVMDSDGVGDDVAGLVNLFVPEISPDGYSEENFGSVVSLSFSLRDSL